jgi:hypothetical protein
MKLVPFREIELGRRASLFGELARLPNSITRVGTTLPMTYIPNLFRSLNIEICDLFEIWCLRFGIFNTSVSFSIKLAASAASGYAEP